MANCAPVSDGVKGVLPAGNMNSFVKGGGCQGVVIGSKNAFIAMPTARTQHESHGINESPVRHDRQPAACCGSDKVDVEGVAQFWDRNTTTLASGKRELTPTLATQDVHGLPPPLCAASAELLPGRIVECSPMPSARVAEDAGSASSPKATLVP